MDQKLHEFIVEGSLQRREEIRKQYPAQFEAAFQFLSDTLRRFHYQKYLVFHHLVYDEEDDLPTMGTALDMMACCHKSRAEGLPMTDDYMRSTALLIMGLCPFVILPGDQP